MGKYFKLRMKMLALTDERVKLTNEMVQGIRVVKMYAWEKTIQKKISDVTSLAAQTVPFSSSAPADSL